MDATFWIDREDCYAIALDGAKRMIPMVSSDAGHALWAGIAEPARGSALVQRLLRPDMIVTATRWEVHLPDEVSYGSPSTNMLVVEEGGYVSADAMREEVNPAGAVVYRYLSLGHPVDRLLATLGHALLREDTLFHTYQMLEAGFRQYGLLAQTRPDLAPYVLVAVARYVAAHCPTARAMLQTARIAVRLHRGDDLTTEAE